ncbi:uncharacterized protein L203_103115 [Cryptococcus depauperatus CBS 7841]|uniref:Uncharacterized protein n=1 Tax=Cryptococcus depauperatus CBS 7841 TaxID=1295531 RepID=A0A1E3IPJ5_9TREE|nr:hypothetical protein L203_01611 [Cryptococcus depauperatus CBS 7841]ODO03813.1 hypothetical protein L204_00152 [Cryptococcus depauperatus CBS 7855]
MARQLMDIEEELLRLWSLVGELSEQLSNNRALVTQLQARAENVKGQAVHAGTGFPLRRFNLDISNEEFQSELEAFSSHLVLENQQLQYENKQANALLKEYEQTLETVMSKFRGVAYSSQQHDLSLHSYYTSLLQTIQTAHSSAQLHDSTSLSLLLNRLSTLLRSALRSLQGEQPDSDFDLAAILPELIRGHVSDDSRDGVHFDSDSNSSKSLPSASVQSIPQPPLKPARFPGFLPGSSGGYAGTEGQSDWALEREMEIQRLEEENKYLRKILDIARESSLPILPLDPNPECRMIDSPEQSRKSSLTVADLEADAAHEAAQRAAEEQQGYDVTSDERRHLATEEPIVKKSLTVPSVLGFRTDGPPPEQAIVDELDGEEMAMVQGSEIR